MKKNYYALAAALLLLFPSSLLVAQSTETKLNEARPEPITSFSGTNEAAKFQIPGSNAAALQALQGNWKIANVKRTFTEADKNADNYWLVTSYTNATPVTVNGTEFVFAHPNSKLTCHLSATDKEVSFHFASEIHPDRISSTTYQYHWEGAQLVLHRQDEQLNETYTFTK